MGRSPYGPPPEWPSCGLTTATLSLALFAGKLVEGAYWFNRKLNPFKGYITDVCRTNEPRKYLVNGRTEDGKTFFGRIYTDD